jgi:hypothetical protein
MDIVIVLVFRMLVQDIGPVTTKTEFVAGNNKSALERCLEEKQIRTIAAGDRMMHAHCEPKDQ